MRRLGLAAWLALGVVAASPALAADKLVDAGKVFPMASNYLKLPAAERSRFTVAYYLKVDGRPLAAPAWIVADGRKTPLPIDANGRVGRVPSLAELDHGKLELGIDAATKVQIVLGIEPVAAPATDLDARRLAEAIAQAAVGSKKAAGLLAVAMPKLDDVVFVDAGSGEIEFADGHKALLPILKGQPTYTPSAQPGANRIRLTRTPIKLDID